MQIRITNLNPISIVGHFFKRAYVPWDRTQLLINAGMTTAKVNITATTITTTTTTHSV